MKQSWVYILECADGSFYTGCTTNLEQRIGQHNAGTFGGYTARRRPVKLLWSQEFSDIHDAIEAERKLKKWTRAKKMALMQNDFQLLHELSQSTQMKNKKKLSK
jgi:predicted GIY-YIG superfamily endonuclease